MAKKRQKDTLQKQLKVYSAAAAGVFALAPSAEALIHYSGIQNLPVNSSTSQDIDFDGNGPQFRIRYYSGPGFGFYGLGLYGLLASAQQIKGTFINPNTYYHSDPLNLSANYQIGPTLANAPRAVWAHQYFGTLNATQYGNTSSHGNFINATGYIGVRFQTTCGLAYGWIHYQGVTTPGGDTSTGTIIDWAYEDNCQPIPAGQTQTQTPVNVPTLNQWGMIIFVFLLAGLAMKRLKKEAE